MTDLLKARHGETVPLALHASRPQQLPTNASPHDPRRTYGGDHQAGRTNAGGDCLRIVSVVVAAKALLIGVVYWRRAEILAALCTSERVVGPA